MAKFNINNQETKNEVIKFIEGLLLDKMWTVEVKRKTKRKTISQEGLYWIWCTAIGEELGYFKDDMHEVLKEKFLPPKVLEVGGEQYEVRSIKGLSKEQMSAYMNMVDLWAGAEMGINLYRPEEAQYRG